MKKPIEIKCTKKEKEGLIEIMSDGMAFGKVYPKDKIKIELETSIKWIIR